MREAAVPGYRLCKARQSTKVLITLGLSGLFLGLLSAALLAIVRTGISPSSVKLYYLGSQVSGSSPLDALMSQGSRPLSELIEVTHLHLLGGSMLLFFLCHLLSLCDMDDGRRIFLYVTSFVSFLVTFMSPWLVIYVNPIFAYVFGPAIVIFLISLLVVSIYPIKEMWVSE